MNASGCVFCTNPAALDMCKSCSRSYDTSRAADDGTIFASMRWASNRVRRALGPFLVTPRKLATLIAYIKAADDVVMFIDTEQWGSNDDPNAAVQSLARARSAVCKAWGYRNPTGRSRVAPKV